MSRNIQKDRETSQSLCQIVIPIYQAVMNPFERASFCRCCQVLGSDFSICIVTHEGLDLSVYQREAGRYGLTTDVQYFAKDYFEGLFGYNKLMISPLFYERFNRFDYILIYQLDAWVFQNTLGEWCAKGYDYIGGILFAPGYIDKLQYADVGNGGLSLRRVEAFRQALQYKFSPSELCHIRRPHHPYITINKRILYFCILFSQNRLQKLRHWFLKYVAEDRFFSCTLAHTSQQLNTPSAKEAVSFAFDMRPAFCYEANGRQLPFGCHGFKAGSYGRFYKPFISESIISESIVEA